MTLAMAIVLLSSFHATIIFARIYFSRLSKSIHFSRQRVRYEDAIFFLYERYRASEILEESSVLRIINRVSANDPLKKLAKVEQLIARSWMATWFLGCKPR